MNLFYRVVALAGLILPALAEEPAEEGEFSAIDGSIVKPLSNPDSAQFSVLIFTATDCPIANAMAPEMARLVQLVHQNGGQFTLVYPDWELSNEEAALHAKEYAIDASIVIDRDHQLVVRTGATVTPEAVLLDRDGGIVYHGRINNLFSDYGDRRRVVTRHDLREAISQLLAGEQIKNPSVVPLGCYIPELPKPSP